VSFPDQDIGKLHKLLWIP